MDKIPHLDVELKQAENLKPEIRQHFKLPEKGLVIKKIKRNSPADFEYIPLKTSFSDHLISLLNQVSMQDFVKKARQRI